MSVLRLDVTHRAPYEGGRSFGKTGPYVYIEGIAHFEIDPLDDANQGVTDIDLAPVNESGKVSFSSDFVLLKPALPGKGNRTMLLDVVNRGNKTVMFAFNDSTKSNNLAAVNSSGNGFLLDNGYTVVFCGWQADVPRVPGLIGMRAPFALQGDEPVSGKIMNQYQCDENQQLLPLADRYHDLNPALDEIEKDAVLRVGTHPTGKFREIERTKWSFVRVEDKEIEKNPCYVRLEGGFQPGKIYQLIYTTSCSRIVGLGFCAVRDICTFLKYGTENEGNPVAGELDTAISYGVSQTGRFLRHYLYNGINADEQGKIAMDGVISHVGGGMRGEFNLRFGQPSKDVCYIIPELFPFTDLTQNDPVTGNKEGLLDRLCDTGHVPKIMFTNSSGEYWRGDAGLIHTDLETMSDAVEHDNVRKYQFAGTQHGPGSYPPILVRESDGLKGDLPFNTVDYRPLLRACIRNMDTWIKKGALPPASTHSNFADGTAVESKDIYRRFEKLPFVRSTEMILNPVRLDYGPDQHIGRTSKLPPAVGDIFPALVSDVDETFNEVSGIRLPDISVPVATNTGWNLRHPDMGNQDLMIGITGGLAGWSVPLAYSKSAREKVGDPRPSIEELYESEKDYMLKVEEEVRKLLALRYIDDFDADGIVCKAKERYRDIVSIHNES